MQRFATFPPLDEGPRTPWPEEGLPALEKFVQKLPFQPSGFRLWFEGSWAKLEGGLAWPAPLTDGAGAVAVLPGWRLEFKRGHIPEKDVYWLVLEGPCSKAFLRVLARLLEDLRPVDRRDLSLTVWR